MFLTSIRYLIVENVKYVKHTILFAHLAFRQLSFWARCVIRRVGSWVNSDNSTKIRQKERSSKMDSPRRDYTRLGKVVSVYDKKGAHATRIKNEIEMRLKKHNFGDF